jgi:ubiquinone/menaquinone biosynthesis C-methylase UbiE
VRKTYTTDFDAFAEEYNFWIQTHDSDYDNVLCFIPHRATRVLDAGCGAGDLSLRLAGHDRNVVGVDISRQMIALAKRHRIEQQKNNVHFIVADLEDPPFPERAFDLVVSFNTLHNTNVNVTLPILRRLVKPGGRMVLHDLTSSLPGLHASPVWQVLYALMSAPGHAKAYGLRTMWRILSFRTSPAWLRHVRTDVWLTPETFQKVYSRFLPGCTFKRAGMGMTAYWENL